MSKKKKKGGCLKWLFIGVAGIFGIGLISTFSTLNSISDREITPSMTPAEIEEKARQSAQKAHERDFKYQTEKEVRQLFKDPSSVKFKGVAYGKSEATGAVIYGEVNGKNSFGAYTGFKRFISSGGTTLFEEKDAGFKNAWLAIAQARITQQTLSELPEDDTELDLIVDMKSIVGGTPSEVAKSLGKADSISTVKQGKKHVYQAGKFEIIFINGKADWITVNNLSNIVFSPNALKAFGLEPSQPLYATKSVLKWENLEGMRSVNLFAYEKGKCDYLRCKYLED